MANQIPESILKQLKWSPMYENRVGGQHCGIPRGVRLTHEETSFEIACSWFRSQIQCKNFCITVFELYLHEIKVI